MRALVIDYIHPDGVDMLRQHMDVTHQLQPPTTEQLAEMVGEYDVLVMRVTPQIDQRLFQRAGRLKLICVAAVGTDHIDLPGAADAGIQVYNLPGVNRDSVAEFTFGLLLCLTRRIPEAAAQMRQGVWNRNGFQHGVELRGRTLGVIGFGRTGSRVAQIAKGFGMRVVVYSPYTSDRRAKPVDVTLTSLEDLLTESDFISVHCSLNAQTKNMIGAEQLALMRPGAFLLNLARGGIVDETALYESLRSGHLAGAAADVFATEPPGAHPLLSLPNFIGTPHIAGPTVDSLWRASVWAAELTLNYFGLMVQESNGISEVAAANAAQ